MSNFNNNSCVFAEGDCADCRFENKLESRLGIFREKKKAQQAKDDIILCPKK